MKSKDSYRPLFIKMDVLTFPFIYISNVIMYSKFHPGQSHKRHTGRRKHTNLYKYFHFCCRELKVKIK